MAIIESIPEHQRRPPGRGGRGQRRRGRARRRACGCSTARRTRPTTAPCSRWPAPPAAVREATLALFAKALEAIDLRRTRASIRGSGAVDVVPVRADRGRDDGRLRRAGARGRRGGGASASSCPSSSTRRPRRSRRGATSKTSGAASSRGWRRRCRRPAGRRTSGPPRRTPRAGATVIGARMPLIAYNINLASDRLDVAKKIAAADAPQQRRASAS